MDPQGISRLRGRTVPHAWVLAAACGLAALGCGRAKDLPTGDKLEPVPYGGGGNDGKQGQLPSLGDIVPVTRIVRATSGIPGWTAADLPFTGPAVAIGQPVTDGQTPVSFAFAYPANNFQLTGAHLVIDTSRDTSDTEGIFVDGVFSGKPPLDQVNATSPRVTAKVFTGSGAPTINSYYNDWSVAHYKRLTRNTFDLDLVDLLKPTTTTILDTLKDGALNVVTGDDSPIYQGFLVYTGLTIAKGALACTKSDPYTFQNVFLHNDGNSVGQSAVKGTVAKAKDAWAAALGTYPATEFYFDQALPRVDIANVSLTVGSLALRVKRSATGAAAVIVNGVGVSEAGFDRTTATSAVEAWVDDPATTAAFTAFLATIPANGTATDATLNLVALLGAQKVKTLLAQGKLNVTVAGSLAAVYSSNYTALRSPGAGAVDGPELSLQGDYFTQICEVPDDPTSPLTQDGLKEQEFDDGTSPIINSVQVGDITATSARIVWLTDEPSTSQVAYGIGNTGTLTPASGQLTTFHVVTLTGLSPYKYYSFQVLSADKWGNTSKSTITVFTTLR